MKKLNFILLTFVTLLALLLTACSKPELPLPPQTGGGKGSFRFVLASLPGESAPVSNLFAIVSVVNSKNEPVLTDRRLALSYNGQYATEKLELPRDGYSIVKFLIADGSGLTRFATPLLNSARGAGFDRPLAQPFSLLTASPVDLSMAVARVNTGDKAEDFGYSAGSFHTPGNGGGQTPEDPFFRIKVKGVFRVGDVVYDSVPSSLRITNYDAAGQMNTRYVALKPGVNEIQLSRSQASYELSVSFWNLSETINLRKSEVDEQTVYVLGGTGAARKLRNETTYRLVNGNYVMESSREFNYDAAGRLETIANTGHPTTDGGRIYFVERFHYSGSRVEKIERFNTSGTLTGYTTFTYDARGRVVNLFEQKGYEQIRASVEYNPNPLATTSGLKVRYLSTHYVPQTYYMTLSGGNRTKGFLVNDSQVGEDASYTYGAGINPFYGLNFPDLFFSHISKNTAEGQMVRYTGGFPASEPYNFRYAYHEDGYPKELVKSYQSPTDHRFLYSTKTTYSYY